LNILKLVFVLFCLGFFTNSLAQIFPTYSERSADLNNPQLLSKVEMEPSEGILNPEEYMIGPGDNIFISVSGLEENNSNLIVNHEGFLYIPRIGIVDLRNKNLAEAKVIIEKKLRENFKNVDIYVGLGEVRKIKVSLVGDVNTQSTYVVTSTSRLIDLIKISAGLSNTSDIRNIKIVSKDGTTKGCDYLSFLRLGDYKQNPFLNDGDVVLVDKVDKTVFVTGQVKYPATYEYRNDETVKELIDLAGGFLYKAKTDSIEVVSFIENGKLQESKYYSIEFLTANAVKLNKSDQVIIREISEYYDEQWVTIKGKIKYPGLYKILRDKTTLTEIVDEAGGFLEDASLIDAVVYRSDADTSADTEFERIKLIPRQDMTDDEYDYFKAKSRQRKGKVVVDFKALFEKNQLSEDITLKKGDEIKIPDKKNYITLIGQVVNPGNVIYNPNLKVEDYIQLAGGFSWRAIESDVRVIKVNTGEWVDADDIDKLEPGDTIWILEDPPGPKFWDVFTTSLAVLGQLAAIVAASIAVIIATR
jgi:polysaccharide biosynthesis/export protein